MDILKPRPHPRFVWPEATILLLFTGLAFLGVSFHEPYFDETQAWLIVRDSSLKDLLLHRLHYEGAPALWYLLLWIMKLSHIPYRGMQYIAAAIAAFGAYVWLRFNPLPRVLSLLLPLTFFVQYQYAVVSRSYVLFPLLAFSLMALYQERRSSPLSFALIAGLLANGSLHMAAFAAGAALLYGVDRWRSSNGSRVHFIRGIALPSTILCLFFALSAATAWPTPDGDFGGKLIDTLRSSPFHTKLVAVATPTDDYPQPAGQRPLAAAVWRRIYPQSNADHRAVLYGKAIKRSLRLLAVVTAPISTSNLLALVFLTALIWNLRRWQIITALAPYFFLIAMCVGVHTMSQHLGMVWIALVCAMWVMCDADLRERAAPTQKRLLLYFSAVLIFALQLEWSAYSLYEDMRLPYDGSKQAADYLLRESPSRTIAGFDPVSTSVNIYLPHTPFFNQKMDYWPYSRTSDPNLFAEETINQSPDVIVLQQTFLETEALDQWFTLAAPGTLQLFNPQLTEAVQQHGYRLNHRFCGEHVFRNAVEMELCLAIYERPSLPAAN